MHIAFDAKRIFRNSAGLGNYSRNLLLSLTQTFPENTYTLFTPKSSSEVKTFNSKNIEIIEPTGLNKKMPALWRSKTICKNIAEIAPDIYHGLSHEIPFGIKKTGVKSVVTMHDLIYVRHPEWYNPIDVQLYKLKYKYSCKAADRIIAISTQTKEDLVTLWNVPEDKIDVVLQGCHERFWERSSENELEAIRIKYQLPAEFVLQVGTMIPRKNHLNTLKAVLASRVNASLVFVGGETAHVKVLKEFIQKNKMKKQVLFLHDVTHEDIPAIYQLAKLSVYPSIYEGFGIPVLESIVSGTPVVTTNASCFKDAGGNAALYANANNVEELAHQIDVTLYDSDVRAKLIQNGVEHAKRFTASEVAKSTMEIYLKILKVEL